MIDNYNGSVTTHIYASSRRDLISATCRIVFYKVLTPFGQGLEYLHKLSSMEELLNLEPLVHQGFGDRRSNTTPKLEPLDTNQS